MPAGSRTDRHGTGCRSQFAALTIGGPHPEPVLRPVVLLSAALAACAPGQTNPLAFLQPSVRLHHLNVRNLGLTGGTLDVVLAVYNPNRLTVRGTRLDAGLDVENSHFGDIVLTEALQLAQQDTTLITAPLAFRWSGVGAAARSVLSQGAVNYRINGTLSVNTPLGQPVQVPFTGQGSVPLMKAAAGAR